MDEKKKLGIVFGVIALFLVVMVAVYGFSGKDEYKVYFLGRSTCGWCSLFKPNIEYIKDTYGVDYDYTDLDTLSESEKSVLYQKLKYDENTMGTPYGAIMKGREFIFGESNYRSEEDLFELYQKYGIIDKSEKFVSSTPNITKIEGDRYKELIESSDKHVVVIAQVGCSACISAKPYLDKIAKENNIDIYYYEVDQIASEDEFNYFTTSLEYIKEQVEAETLSTPTIMITQNKEVIASMVGFEGEEKTVSLLKEQGIITE